MSSLLRLLAILTLVVSLVACGSDAGGAAGDDDTDAGGTTTTASDEAAAESDQPEASETASGEGEVGGLTQAELDQIIADAIAANEELDEAAELEQTVEAADTSTDLLIADVDAEPQTMDQFLTAVLNDIDGYWTATFAAEQLPEPFVQYLWPTTGEIYDGGCGALTDDKSAFYCPTSDTIVVSQQVAYDLWNGLAQTAYGPQSSGRLGDFAVAYLVAHEFGHSIQAELDLLNKFPVWQTELMADCFAGNWANSAYYAGLLEAGDIEEALETANLIGDYETSHEQHHGTPLQRVEAFSLGWNNGNPVDCFVYLEIGEPQ